MRRILLALAAIGMVVATTASTAGAAVAQPAKPAVAASPDAASPWVAVALHAEAGNGCVEGNEFGAVPSVYSLQCNLAEEWLFRDMTRSTGLQAGDHLEFVTADKTKALTWKASGGWQLATPDDNSTYVLLNGFFGDSLWQELISPAAATRVGMYPEGAGQALGAPLLSVTTAPPDEWLECPVLNPQCTNGTPV